MEPQIKQENEPEQFTLDVSVRPMATPYIIRTKVPHSAFQSKKRIFELHGSKNADFDTTVAILVEVGEEFDGRPVIWIDADSVQAERQHDGVEVVGISYYMPRLATGNGLAVDDDATKTAAEELDNRFKLTMQTSRPLDAERLEAEIQALVERSRGSRIDEEAVVQEGDIVQIEAWNAGIGKGASVKVRFKVDRQTMPELSDLLVGNHGGHSAVGSFPIRNGERVANAQKVRLDGVVKVNERYDVEALMAELQIENLDGLKKYVYKQVVDTTPLRVYSLLAQTVCQFGTEPIPPLVVSQIAEQELLADVKKFGMPKIMADVGLASTKDTQADFQRLVDILIETKAGNAVHADIVFYWMARYFDLLPDHAVLAQWMKAQGIQVRIPGLFRFAREAIVKRYAEIALERITSFGAP